MPKVNDIKQYWKEIAGKAGLSEDEAKQVLSVMENEKFARAFTDGFKPLPDYSHDLDDVRNRTATETKKQIDAQNQKVYEENLAKYNEYVRVIDKAKKYEEMYGPLDENATRQQLQQSGLSKEDLEKLVEARLNAILPQRDKTVLDLLEIREQHMLTFKKPLDTSAFEEAWKSHPEWGGSLKLAYKSFVEPEIGKIRDDEFNAKLEAKYQEGIRDGFSRRALPTDHQPKIFSNFFDRKEDVAKLSEAQQDQHSREAFLEGFREANKA